MAVIKLVEPYAVTSLRNDVRDSLMMAGEEAVLLQLYHPGDPDAVPCSLCGEDIYPSAESDCSLCLGTNFQGGVRQAVRVWTLFTDHQVTEQLTKRGTYQPDVREIQFEAFPLVTEHDVVVRVRRWNPDGTPAEVEGFYMLTAVTRVSLRTGNRFGQYTWDVVGQRAQLSELSPTMKMITQYPILGQAFLPPSSPAVAPTSAVVQPDDKVVFVPTGGTRTFAQTIGNGIATSFTVSHNLGSKDVAVSLYDTLTNEEIDADVTHRSVNTVTVRFGTAPPTGAFRVVVMG